MGVDAWAGEYVSNRFQGCECLGKIVLNKDPSVYVYLFKLTDDVRARKAGRPVGAWYNDGACMIWPREWYETHEDKIRPVKTEVLRELRKIRIKLNRIEHERREAWEEKMRGLNIRSQVTYKNHEPMRVVKRVMKGRIKKSASNV